MSFHRRAQDSVAQDYVYKAFAPRYSSLQSITLLGLGIRVKRPLMILLLAVSSGSLANAVQEDALPAKNPAASSSGVDTAKTTSPQYSEEELKQIQLTERFLSVLEKSPRRGTALDRIYGHHVEFGTLDDFIAKLNESVAAEPNNGAKWMMLGLFESQRGTDGEAINAFAKAESLRPTDALAPYYASQCLLRGGQTDQAVAALERAIAAKPPRADLMEIYQQLGRVLQRAQRPEEALNVWKRFEKEFPDDPRVLEQIATTLLEENELPPALERFVRLVALTKDDYKKTIFRASAAEVKIRSNDRQGGIADLEAILADLNPTSWLHRDVRRRIEQIFLKSGDQDGLVTYYEGWIAKNPEDVEGMTRLAKFLSASARVPEAVVWMEKAIKLAPTRFDLRKAFIEQLVEQQRFADADKEYAKLIEAAPENTDYFRDWGRLVLRNRDVPQVDREARATQIWSRMLVNHPKDASLTAQVADLFRNAKLQDKAVELYQKAIDLAPENPQYREYLGEFYHLSQQPEKALEVWAAISQPPRRTAENLARVAEVYNSFGYQDKAMVEIAEACKLQTKDFGLYLQAATYHARGEKFDEGLGFLENAEKLASNDEQRGEALAKRIEIYQSSERLGAEIEALVAEIEKTPSAKAGDWYVLSRLHEANRDYKNANAAIVKALELEPKSVLFLTAQARNFELVGDLEESGKIFRQLVDIDRRSRDEHWIKISRLEMEMGRTDAALEAANQLIIASPSNTENYQYLSGLCFQLGKSEEGLDALRKAIRINPNDPQLLMALGTALSNQLETREAIEIYWRAFEKSSEIDDKTSLTQKLVPLYEQLNQFDQLLERFKRDGQEEDKRRDTTICLAQAYQSSGDLSSAKQELEGLLSENTKDSNLLQQLAKLCNANGELEQAIAYQRQLVSIAPGSESESPLATMLQEAGETDEATEILVRLVQSEENPLAQLKTVDSLLQKQNYEAALGILAPLSAKDRDNWELLYREAVALIELDRPEEAKLRLQRIVDLTIPLTTPSQALLESQKKAAAKEKSERLRGLTQNPSAPALPAPALALSEVDLSFVMQMAQVRLATKLENQVYYSNQQQPFWSPSYYGLARAAAFCWSKKIDQAAPQASKVSSTPEAVPAATPQTPSLASNVESNAKSPDASRQELIDGLYLAIATQQNETVFETAMRLAETSGGNEERKLALAALTLKSANDPNASSRSDQSGGTKTPLPNGVLDKLLSFLDEMPDEGDSQAVGSAGGNIISSGGMYYVQVGNTYAPLQGFQSMKPQFLPKLIEELVLAGRTEEATKRALDIKTNARKSSELLVALGLMSQLQLNDQLGELFEKYCVVLKDEIQQAAKSPANQQLAYRGNLANSLFSNQTQVWFGKLASEEENQLLLKYAGMLLDCTEEFQSMSLARMNQANRTQSMQATLSGRSVSMGRQYYSWHDGKKNSNIQLPSNSLLHVVSRVDERVLAQLYASLISSESTPELISFLESRLQTATDENQLWRKLSLASVLTWTSENERATELATDAIRSLKSNDKSDYSLVYLHLQLQEYDKAKELLEANTKRDPAQVKQREMLHLQIAERTGDTERATQAVRTLFGLRLTAQEQTALIPSAKRLGLDSIVDAIAMRSKRNAGNQLSSQSTLMVLLSGQGKTDEALQLARQILQRTSSFSKYANIGNITINPRYYSNNSAESQIRGQALQTLKRAGELSKIMSKLESQIDRSPESTKLYEQLFEFAEADGQKDKIKIYIEKLIELRPKQVGWRWKYAELLREQGKPSEACDQYMVVIRERPTLLANDFYEVYNLFRQANRVADVEKAVAECDFSSFSQSYMVSNMIQSLVSNRQSQESDAVITLLERVVKQFPNEGQNLLSSLIYSGQAPTNPRTLKLVQESIIPSPDQARSAPWFSFSGAMAHMGDGKIRNSAIVLTESQSQFWNASEAMASLTSAIEKAPDWKAGQFMLAVLKVRLEGDQRKEAIAAIEKLATDQISDNVASDVARTSGQLISDIPELRSTAIKLYEHAIKQAQATNSLSQLQYSVVWGAVNLFKEAGEPERAGKLILQNLKSNIVDSYNQNYHDQIYAENALAASQKLRELGLSADALAVAVNALKSKSRLDSAGLNYSQNRRHFANQFQRIIDEAIQSIDSTNSDAFLAAILPEPTSAINSGKPASAIQLSLTVANATDSKEDTGIRLDTENLLNNLSRSEPIKELIGKRLDLLRTKCPEDFSIQLLHAIHHASSAEPGPGGRYDFSPLTSNLSSRPLEEIPQGKKANGRQQREAEEQMAVWILARKLLATEDKAYRDLGVTLANHALTCANRQRTDEFAIAIQDEWANICFTLGDIENAKQIWQELLGRIADRKAAVSSPSPFATSAIPGVAANQPAPSTKIIPPLTNSQFQSVIRIARNSALNDLPDLSKQALRESLRGGPPVDDLPISTSSSGGVMIAAAPSIASSRGSLPGQEVEGGNGVSSAVLSVIRLWKGEAYPPLETYLLLKDQVFPASPSKMVIFSPDASSPILYPRSLGDELVQSAIAAGKTDELESILSEYEKSNVAKAQVYTMQSLLGVKAKRPELARKGLTGLAELIEKSNSPSSMELVRHAALPATDDQAHEEAAYALLAKYVNQGLDPTNMRPGEQASKSLDPIAKKVNKYGTKSQSNAEIKDYYEKKLLAIQKQYSNYSGEYSTYRIAIELASIARELAEVDSPESALSFLGRAVDTPLTEYEPVNVSESLSKIIAKCRLLPAQEKYAVWKGWTMPDSNRRTIRIATIEMESLPSSGPVAIIPSEPLQSNLLELIQSAKEAGKVEEIRELAKQAESERIDGAETILLLCDIVSKPSNDTSIALKAFFEKSIKAAQEASRNNLRRSASPMGRTQALFAALMQEKIDSVTARSVADDLGFTKMPVFTTLLERRLSENASEPLGTLPSSTESTQAKPFKHWGAISLRGSSRDQGWYFDGDSITRLARKNDEALFLDYPLSGDFAIEFDAFNDSMSESDVAFNGLFLSLQNGGNTLRLANWAGSEQLDRGDILQVNQGNYGRIGIDAQGDRVKVLLNGYCVIEEKRSPSSPWFGLWSGSGKTTSFRNLRFLSPPTVPDEVPLIVDERLDGWKLRHTAYSFMYFPAPRTLDEIKANPNSSAARTRPQNNWPVPFWNFEAGVLTGAIDERQGIVQNWVEYARPLHSNESVRYEFYYEPGISTVYPTFGGLSMQLIEQNVVPEIYSVPSTNVPDQGDGIPDTKGQSTGKLALKAKAWNQAELALKDDKLSLSINGELVFTRTVADIPPRIFGLHSPNGMSMKVRNAVLSGDWGKQWSRIPQQDLSGSKLLEMTKAVSSAKSSVLKAIAGLEFDRSQAIPLALEAREKPSLEMYEKLRDWVLPDESRSDYRMVFRYLPLDEQKLLPPERFEMDRIASPAIEMVRLAKQFGQLDALKKEVEENQDAYELNVRARSALQLMIALAKEDLVGAKKVMQEIVARAQNPLPSRYVASQRAPDLFAALAANQREELRPDALKLVNQMFQFEQSDHRTAQASWIKDFANVYNTVLRSSAPEKDQIDARQPSLSQWHAVHPFKARDRVNGELPSQWVHRSGGLEHIPGASWQQLYFQSPIQGKFEISARRSTYGAREQLISYGMHAAEPNGDLTQTRVVRLMHGPTTIPGNLTVPNWGTDADFKIKVDGKNVQTLVNGAPIHSFQSEYELAPWIMLQADMPWNSGTISNLQIQGDIQIPSELEILKTPTAWRSNYFGERFVFQEDANSPYYFIKNELKGNRRLHRDSKDVESAMFYARPMLEDGELEFETFYEPGEIEVHPVIGRSAVLLTPDGAMHHRLSLAQLEPTSKANTVQERIGGAQTLPLKAKEWNHVLMRLRGDELEVVLNGTSVAKLKVEEPKAERHIGLFRYSDATKCHVRNMKYRGEWPKTLPGVDKQELAVKATP